MRSLKRTPVLKIDPRRPEPAAISLGARMLKAGGLVVFPTETVYGLGANLLNDKAIARLYRVKKRPKSKPLTVHIHDPAVIKKMGCRLDARASKIVSKLWPGPLTIILKSKTGEKIGFRMPDNTVALELIKKAGVPIVAPSANISGRKPPATADEASKQLDGRIDMVIDGGRTRLGMESTVLDLASVRPIVLREGAIKKKAVSRITSDE